MSKQRSDGSKFSIAGLPVYPHIKLTREKFPRALATRMLKEEGDEYFGAFLSRTSVRILIDFLNRTFRLRSCAIAIDGTFPVPCTQYYAKRCVAPCVADLCDSEHYLEIVELVRLFLRNDREQFVSAITKRIERAADHLDFETAAFFRDILQAVESYWSNARRQVWLDDSVDTLDLQVKDDVISVIIISQRRRRALGEMVYRFARQDDVSATQATRDVIEQFYRYHLPREIRVSQDFEDRTKLARELGAKFGRKLNIVVASDTIRLVTTDRALDRTKERLELEAISPTADADEVKNELVRILRLSNPPSRIEAFDVAHISATGFAAGVSVWNDGKDLPDDHEHWLSDRESELDTLQAFVADRVARTAPDLILIDGGRSQLNAAVDAVSKLSRPPRVLAAVKPKGKHTSISHLLTDDGRRIQFDPDAYAFRLLQRLRDEAHALANSAHRLGRDMMHFYELATMLPSLNERDRQELLREFGSIRAIVNQNAEAFVNRFGIKKARTISEDLTRFRAGMSPKPQPLIVPIRFVETDGGADDLIPIETRH